MIAFDPSSRISVVLQNSPPDTSDRIGFYPSIISDITASSDELLSGESTRSFMQAQWRMASENMLGLGIISNGWA